jgi:hypothetical protein
VIERDAQGKPVRLWLDPHPRACLHVKTDWFHAGRGFELRCVQCGKVFHEAKVSGRERLEEKR